MSQLDRTKSVEADSEDEELAENEEKNLESILRLFPFRKPVNDEQKVDDITFDRIKQLMKCPVCLEIFKDPVYIKECMHRFCK
jgi:E3 ubiquitin-protein ligase RNF1/2